VGWTDPAVSSTAQVIQGGLEGNRGTAWLCGSGQALTAAHCLGNRKERTLYNGDIALHFPWGESAARVIWHDFDNDVALLELTDAVHLPPDVKPLRSTGLADAPANSTRGWSAFGFPRVQDTGMYLTGKINGLSGQFEGRRVIQLGCDQGGLGRLEGASGAAVCHNGGVVGIIRHGLLDQLTFYAAPIESVLENCPTIATSIEKVGVPHPLHQFPKGPRPDETRISNRLIDTFTELNSHPQDVDRLFRDAARMRRAADPDDPRVTFLKVVEVGLIGIIPAAAFWTTAFEVACGHGPRMLAALILSQPDTLFDDEALRDREDLLEYLRTFNPKYQPPF
jgi:hypothetical protein